MRFWPVPLCLALALALAPGCRGDDDDPKDDAGNDDTPGTTVQKTIFELKDGSVATGTVVELPEVVVVAVDGFGDYTGSVYVQEAAGGANSGLQLFGAKMAGGGSITDLKVGDRVKAVGEFSQWDGPQSSPFEDHKPRRLYLPTVTKLSVGTAPDPSVVSVADLISDTEGPKWESVLVKVENVKITGEPDPKYDQVPLAGGLEVDVDLSNEILNKNIGDCLTLTGVMMYFYQFRINPRGPADVADATGCVEAQEVTISELQNPSGGPASGTEVKITSAVVSALDTTLGGDDLYRGFWIQEPGTGGEYKGIFVFHKWNDQSSIKPPALGNAVEVTATYEEFHDLSELGYVTSIVDKGDATDIEPVDVGVDDVVTGAANFEKWEGVLIKVNNITVGDIIDTYGFKVDGKELEIKNDLYDFMSGGNPSGTFTSITGVLTYSFDKAQLLPRSAEDMVHE